MNAKQHFALGAGVGVILNLLKQGFQMQLDPARKFDWFELAGYGVIGGTIATSRRTRLLQKVSASCSDLNRRT